jgi:hypothetical protein
VTWYQACWSPGGPGRNCAAWPPAAASPDQFKWVDELTSAVLEHSAAGFLYFNAGDTPSDVALGRWAEEVVPAVRLAIAKP